MASITAPSGPRKFWRRNIIPSRHGLEDRSTWRWNCRAARRTMFRANELERLFRDARCGRFHPANTFLTHEIVAKTPLGIDRGELPRWG